MAAVLYRKYKSLSDDLFDPVPEFTGKGDDIRKLVQTRHKALRCAELRTKFTETYVPEHKRDNNHAYVIQHLQLKAAECQEIIKAAKPQVQTKPVQGCFPYIDIKQQQEGASSTPRKKQHSRRRGESPHLKEDHKVETEVDMEMFVVSLRDYVEQEYKRKHHQLWNDQLMRRMIMCCRNVEGACIEYRLHFDDRIKMNIAFTIARLMMQGLDTKVLLGMTRDPCEILKFGLRYLKDGPTSAFESFCRKFCSDLQELENLSQLCELYK